jgi:hypothetical protein
MVGGFIISDSEVMKAMRGWSLSRAETEICRVALFSSPLVCRAPPKRACHELAPSIFELGRYGFFGTDTRLSGFLQNYCIKLWTLKTSRSIAAPIWSGDMLLATSEQHKGSRGLTAQNGDSEVVRAICCLSNQEIYN